MYDEGRSVFTICAVWQMSSVVSAATAFYQLFRDREAKAGTQQSEVGGGLGSATENAAATNGRPTRPADQAGSPASLSPSQIWDRLDALITRQLAAGKLSDEQGAELRKVLYQDAPQGDVHTEPTATPASPQSGPSPGATAASEPGMAWHPSEALATFIQNLQGGQVSSASYGSTGSAPARSAGSQLLDFNT